jgi:hypothetical protein
MAIGLSFGNGSPDELADLPDNSGERRARHGCFTPQAQLSLVIAAGGTETFNKSGLMQG